MCEALGYRVARLEPVRITYIHLGTLKKGRWRISHPKRAAGSCRRPNAAPRLGEAGVRCFALIVVGSADTHRIEMRRLHPGGGLRGLLCIAVVVGCGGPTIDAGGEETTGSGSATQPSSSSSSSSSSSEESSSAESSESSADESSSGGPPSVCGDGTAEADELCDDGNRTDEDGCNADCVPSGSLVWSWEPPEGASIDRIDYGPDDHLWVLTSADFGVSVRELDRESEELTEIFVASFMPPAGTEGPGMLESVDIEAVDGGVYFGEYRWWAADGEYTIAGQLERIADDGWVVPVENGIARLAARPSGGVVVLDGIDVLQAFDGDGNASWTYPMEASTSDVRTLPDGVVAVAVDRVVALDDAGAERWAFPEPAPEVNFSLVSVGTESMWVIGYEVPPSGDSEFLWRLDFDGNVLDAFEDPMLGFWHEVTPSGNLVWVADGGAARPLTIEKLDADLERLWAYAWGTEEGWRQLEVDSSGSVAAAHSYELRLLAP